MGTLWLASNPRVALVTGSGCNRTLSGDCLRLSEHVSGSAIRHDLDCRHLGTEARFSLEKVVADSAMGRGSILDLANKFCPQQHPLEGWRILHSRRQARARH